ncbi:hypothetical protein ACFU6E_26050 [Bacillus cereus]
MFDITLKYGPEMKIEWRTTLYEFIVAIDGELHEMDNSDKMREAVFLQ